MPVALHGEAPDRAADAEGIVVVAGGRPRLDQPAGRRRPRLGGACLPQKQAHDAALPGAKGEPAAGGEIELLRVTAELGKNGGKARAAEPFLEHPQRLSRPLGADQHEASRIEPESIEAGTVEIAAFAGGDLLPHPQDRPIVDPGEAGEDGGGEAGRGSAVAGRRGAELMQGGAAEPAGEQPVGLRLPQRKNRSAPARREEMPRRGSGGLSLRKTSRVDGNGMTFDLGDPSAQVGKAGVPPVLG